MNAIKPNLVCPRCGNSDGLSIGKITWMPLADAASASPDSHYVGLCEECGYLDLLPAFTAGGRSS